MKKNIIAISCLVSMSCISATALADDSTFTLKTTNDRGSYIQKVHYGCGQQLSATGQAESKIDSNESVYLYPNLSDYESLGDLSPFVYTTNTQDKIECDFSGNTTPLSSEGTFTFQIKGTSAGVTIHIPGANAQGITCNRVRDYSC